MKLSSSMILDKIVDFSKKSQGKSLKAKGLIFWILAIFIQILTNVKTEFGKRIKMVVFMGDEDYAPPFPPPG